MPLPLRYFDLSRDMRNPFHLRLSLASYARQHGIKAAARLFQTTVPTVRKWLRRYQAAGLPGLQALSRAPHSCPHKIAGEREERILELRRQLPTFSAQRLRCEFDLPASPGAAYRIWRQHGLVPKRRRKYQKKQDLAAVKATWRLFQQISADTKDLDDIPHYWPQMQARRLPAIQYTAREVRSGLQFLAFASRRSAAASTLFAQRIQSHLARCGVELQHLAWQTDNGSEFLGGHDDLGHRAGFPAALGDSQHPRIPPAAHTYHSDVETVHRLIEDEFFDLESFRNRPEFFAKATIYQLYFNLARPNSHKENKTPWQIIEQLAPRSPLDLCLLPPINLDYFLNPQGGYHLPLHP